jgi:hypothetical protein
MKKLAALVLAGVVCAASMNTAPAESLSAGEVDFGSFEAPSGGSEFVEVNLGATVISMAARLFEKEEPEVAKLLGGLHRVHVTAIGMDSENRLDLKKRAEKIRAELNSKGWERLVTARKQAKDVGIYLKSKSKEVIQGLAIIVMDGKDKAVFVNIVGDIHPDQISLLGEKLHIDQLKKLGRAEKE